MKRAVLILLLVTVAPARGASWHFDEPVTVTQAHGPKIFHHLDAAGRKHIAVSGGKVAVVWEDNRSGKPHVYCAFKVPGAPGFGHEQQLSRDEAYQPVVVAVPAGRFLFAWEEAGRVQLRLATETGPIGKPAALGVQTAQPSVAGAGRTVWAVWTQKTAAGSRVQAARIEVRRDGFMVEQMQSVDPRSATGDQLNPSIAIARNGTVAVAWEDRRAGHTRIHYSAARSGGTFQRGEPLNEVVRTQDVYGRGTGAARAVLAAYGEGIAAVWLDKRGFQSGYDVYAALDARATGRFGPNQKVQDGFGDGFSQWHAAAAGLDDGPAVVWDDNRDDTADVFLTWPVADGWSENVAVASGPGQQREPSVAADAGGNLHLVWVEQEQEDGGTRIRYLRFRRQ